MAATSPSMRARRGDPGEAAVQRRGRSGAVAEEYLRRVTDTEDPQPVAPGTSDDRTESRAPATGRSGGVATDYWDWRGNHIVVSAETSSLFCPLSGSMPEHQSRSTWRYRMPVDTGGRGCSHHASLPGRDGSCRSGYTSRTAARPRCGSNSRPADPGRCRSGGELGTATGGRRAARGEATFVLPDDLPLGYHTLHARSDNQEATGVLIVAPAWLGCPERMGSGRAWGLSTQLYSLRSQRSWGVGDLADLTDLAVWSGADLGAGSCW